MIMPIQAVWSRFLRDKNIAINMMFDDSIRSISSTIICTFFYLV
jgi:hypothetical protein